MTALIGYRAYGLNIASEFEIPGGIRVEHPVADADIVIRNDRTALGTAEAINGPYSRSGTALLFDAVGVARYYAPSSGQLSIEAYAGADPHTVGELLIATALPMLMWMRGGIMLHAAGIVPAGTDKAIAIAGPSGIGKSTLAAGLIRSGGQLIGDDSLWLTLTADTVMVRGLSATLFQSRGPNSPRTETDIAPESRVEQAKLGAIITLCRSGRVSSTPLRRLEGADTIEAFLRNRHRPKIPAIMGLDTRLLPECMLHCRTIPIYELTIRDGDVAGSQQQLSAIISDSFRSE